MTDDMVVEAKADPKRPYKVYAVLVATGIAQLLTFAAELPRWLIICLTVAAAMLAVFVTPNPIKVTKSRTVATRRTGNYDSPTLWDD